MKNESKSAGGWRGLGPLLLVPALSVMLLPGCGDVFQATNPGTIQEDDLRNRDALENVVTGMSADFSNIVDELAFFQARASDEMAGSGSYTNTNLFGRGVVRSEDIQFLWEDQNLAMFNARNGIGLMQDVLGDDFQGNPLVSRAHMFHALSVVQYGENFCQVIFSTEESPGEPQPRSAAFERAIQIADEGITHARQAGETAHELTMIGVKARANVGLNNWSAARQAAQEVIDRGGTGFEQVAIYTDNSGRERSIWWLETHNRFETSAFGTFAQVAGEAGDPRVPFTDCRTSDDCSGAVGAGGNTPHLRQEKFPDPGSDIPVVTGEEMHYIVAEAALRDGDPATAIEHMNAVRAQWDELDPIPASLADDYTGATDFNADDPVWAMLDLERGLTLWLEARRLWDLYRWDHPFLDGGKIVLEPEGRRAAGMPIGRSEVLSNPNVSDAPGC